MHKSAHSFFFFYFFLFFFFFMESIKFLTITAGAVQISLATTKGAPESTTLPQSGCKNTHAN